MLDARQRPFLLPSGNPTLPVRRTATTSHLAWTDRPDSVATSATTGTRPEPLARQTNPRKRSTPGSLEAPDRRPCYPRAHDPNGSPALRLRRLRDARRGRRREARVPRWRRVGNGGRLAGARSPPGRGLDAAQSDAQRGALRCRNPLTAYDARAFSSGGAPPRGRTFRRSTRACAGRATTEPRGGVRYSERSKTWTATLPHAGRTYSVAGMVSEEEAR